jgi:hypothetical protein
MTEKDDDTVVPIRPLRPVTAAQLREAQLVLRRAQLAAMELFAAAIAPGHRRPGITAPEAIENLGDPEMREAAHDLRAVLIKAAMSE